METEKTITVSGRGNIHIVPDVTRVEIKIISLFDTYEIAYQMAEDNLRDIKKIMVNNKLDTKLPKTIHFNICKQTRSKYDKYHNYEGEEFIGYELSQTIKIDLGMDNKLLTKVVREIGGNLTDVELNIGYTVRDPRPHQLKMLERAVKDATEKARIMAQAAGCSLGLVKTIDYSEKEIHIYSQARNIAEPCDAAKCTESSLDITPEDLCAGEDVVVTWYLSNNKVMD